MDKLQVILRAKSYMDMLSNGIDPISGKAVEGDSILEQERLKKCFAFVSEILEEVVKTNGIVELPANESHAGYTAVKNKAKFSITEQQVKSVLVTKEPIVLSAFLKNVNATVDQHSMEKLSLKTINTWLVSNGYLSESKEPTLINKTIRSATPSSERIGIVEEEFVDTRTGEVKTRLLFSQNAQQFMLENINQIAAEKV